MPFCYELRTDVCGVPIQNVLVFAFCHYVVHGIFVCAFVFSNTAFPPFYYVDYMYGIAGAVLIPVAILGSIIAQMRTHQPLRCIWATVVVINVLFLIVSSIWYAAKRWNDVITTAFTRAIRRPMERDFPDYFWYTLTVLGCFMLLPFLIYLIYVMSYMCNKWKSSLFIYNYETAYGPYYGNPYTTHISVPLVPQSNAYPTQKTY